MRHYLWASGVVWTKSLVNTGSLGGFRLRGNMQISDRERTTAYRTSRENGREDRVDSARTHAGENTSGARQGGGCSGQG